MQVNPCINPGINSYLYFMKQTQIEIEETYNVIAPLINKLISSNRLIDEIQLGREKVLRIAQCINDKKTTKSKSKAPKEILGRSFVYSYEDFTFGVYVNMNNKIQTMCLYKIKAPKGSLYVCFYRTSETNVRILCFKAHVFDRYITRLKNPKINDRESAIKHFVHITLKAKGLAHRNETDHIGTSTILMLGQNFCLGQDFREFKLINTFIEDSMLNPRQRMLMEAMKKWNENTIPVQE